jgi:hypothetical protein
MAPLNQRLQNNLKMALDVHDGPQEIISPRSRKKYGDKENKKTIAQKRARFVI